MKKTITVLFLTILMLTSFAVIFAQNVKASSTEVKVLSYTWYTSTSSVNAGDLIAVGEIQNVGSKTIGNVTLTGDAFGLNGEALATTQAQAFVYDMLPGQKAPFYIDFSQSNGIQNPQASGSSATTSWVTSVSDVSVTVASVTDTSATQYLQLQIPKGASMLYTPSVGYPEYALTGYIQNNGTKTAENVFAVVTFYNSTGAAVAMNFTSILSSSLAPGAEVSFYATPVDTTDSNHFNITNYAVLIDSYTPGSGSTSTSGSQTSSPINSTTQFTLSIVVIVVIVVVVIVALMMLRKRQKLPIPPPPPPPPSPEVSPPQETP